MSRLESLIGTKAKANTRSILQFTSTIPPVKADNKSTVKQAEAENRDIDSSVQIGAEENGDETEKNKYADFDGKQAKYRHVLRKAWCNYICKMQACFEIYDLIAITSPNFVVPLPSPARLARPLPLVLLLPMLKPNLYFT